MFLMKIAGLACGPFGTGFLAAAFTPVGLTPPPATIRGRIRWFVDVQGGVSVRLNQRAFFAGLLLLAAAVIIGAVGT